MKNLKQICCLLLLSISSLAQVSYIEADPNSPKQFSQDELAKLYAQSQQTGRNTGTNPFAPQLIKAEDYMSGDVQLPKEIIQQMAKANQASKQAQAPPQ